MNVYQVELDENNNVVSTKLLGEAAPVHRLVQVRATTATAARQAAKAAFPLVKIQG